MLVRSEPAQAQTVAATGQPYPYRYVDGNFLGTSERPQNMTPLGINHDDCIRNMVLRFNLSLSGFNGTQSLQVWASKSGDCTQATARGVGSNAVTTCWIVGQGFTGLAIPATTTQPFDIRVQDLVGSQNAPPSPPNFVQQGPSACSAQSTFVAVPIDIYFIPVDTGLNTVGTPYKYSIVTDLVGPPAPTKVNENVGNTIFNLSWTPNTDADTTGYDVFLDPIPGQEGASVAPMSDATVVAAPTLVCTDAGASAQPQDSAMGDGSGDGSVMDATTSNPEASCINVVVPPTGSTSTSSTLLCPSADGGTVPPSAVLAMGIVQDGGTVQETDEAGNPIEGGLVSNSGGLSSIPADAGYLFAAGTAGVTVSDKNTGSYVIKGLLNGVTYTAVVAAVDGSGNIGPPSAEVCDYPALVNDFWDLYKQAGGRAGGGCALETVGESAPAVAGFALVAAASAFIRRRRGSRAVRPAGAPGP